MWELLKRFPTMPPFGSSWFGVLNEFGHPLADLRLSWILENHFLDQQESRKSKESDLEFAGFLANPSFVSEYLKQRDGKAAPVAEAVRSEGVKLVTDTSPFWDKMRRVEAGEVVLRPASQDERDALAKVRNGVPVGPVRRPRATLDDEVIQGAPPGLKDK
jgi:hypothetical protein